jgi:AbrB family looped-hinge helix DNA binding protein
VRATGTARIGPAGRIVIPAAIRAALNLREGDKVLLELVGDQLVVTPQWVGMRWAQELAARLIPKGRSLADELSADRAGEIEPDDRNT